MNCSSARVFLDGSRGLGNGVGVWGLGFGGWGLGFGVWGLGFWWFQIGFYDRAVLRVVFLIIDCALFTCDFLKTRFS